MKAVAAKAAKKKAPPRRRRRRKAAAARRLAARRKAARRGGSPPQRRAAASTTRRRRPPPRRRAGGHPPAGARAAGDGSPGVLPTVSVSGGVPMNNGQSDIDAAPAGTTFCLSGTHNWTLYPKSGDQLDRSRGARRRQLHPVRDRGGLRVQRRARRTSRSATTRRRTSAARSTCPIGPVAGLDAARPAGPRQRHQRRRRRREPRRGLARDRRPLLQQPPRRLRRTGSGNDGRRRRRDRPQQLHRRHLHAPPTPTAASRPAGSSGSRTTSPSRTPASTTTRARDCGPTSTPHDAMITNNQRLQQLGRRDLHRDLLGRDDHGQHRVRQRFRSYEGSGNGCAWLLGGGITLARRGPHR